MNSRLQVIQNLETKIDTLETKIDTLETKIDNVVNLLEKLIQQNTIESEKINTNLNCINHSTRNMDHHIHFVENVFDVVKYPFSSLLRLYYRENKTNEIQDILDIPYRKKLDALDTSDA
jgi:hypothetical protein